MQTHLYRRKISLIRFLFKFILIFVLIPGKAQVEVKVEDATCNGKRDGKIDVTVNGPLGPYTFVWPDGSVEDHWYNVPKGTYKLIVKDRDGCSLEKEIKVGVKEDKPKVRLIGAEETKVFCYNQDNMDVELTASTAKCEGCQYFWATGAKSKSIKVSVEAMYYVRVADKEGCFAADTAHLDIDIKSDGCDKKDDEDENGEDDKVDVGIIGSKDPNDILGPEGVGPGKYVSVNDKLNYKIRFENDPEHATAPAQKVVIRSPLSPHLNMFSLRLGSFGFGNYIFNVPENTTFYSTRLDVKDSLHVLVDVIAGLDVEKREAFWIFQSIDPATNLEPAANLGFLLINDSITHQGEGFVDFSIYPEKTSETGDTIEAFADIIFDINGSILTPKIFNTIDALAPSSEHLFVHQPEDSVFTYGPSLRDDYRGSGVKAYDLYLSDNDGQSYMLYLQNIPRDSAVTIKGDPRKLYCIYTVAKDSVGNKEFKVGSDRCFQPSMTPFIQFVNEEHLPEKICQGDLISLDWSSVGVANVDVFLKEKSSDNVIQLATAIPSRYRTFEWAVPFLAEFVGKKFTLILKDADSDTLAVETSKTFEIFDNHPIKISSSNPAEFCEGGSTELSVSKSSGALQWSTGSTSESIVASASGQYSVKLTQANGCVSTDSIKIKVHPFPAKPVILSSTDYKVCPLLGSVLSTDGSYSAYKWSNGSDSSAVKIFKEGRFAVTVENDYGCEIASDTVWLVAEKDSICSQLTGLPSYGANVVDVFEAIPNPFAESSMIRFSLPTTERIRIVIYTMSGVEVGELYNGTAMAGKNYSIDYKRKYLSGGTYFCKLITESGKAEVLKLMIIQ